MYRCLKNSPAFRNAAASYFAFVSTTLWGLLSIPLAVAFLDRSEIGLWAVVNTIIGYLVWMDLGIGAATGRLIADSIASNDHREIDCWWSATRFILWIQGALVIILGYFLVPLALRWTALSPSQLQDARFLLIGGAVIIGLSFSMRGTTGLLTAQNRFHWIPFMQGIIPWVNLTAFYLLLRAGWGLRAYILALAASETATWLLCHSFIIFGPYKPKWNRAGIDRNRIGKLFKLSGNMTVVGLVASVLQGLPNLLVARFGGLTSVPIYNFSSRGPMLGSGLVSRTYQSFTPTLLRLHVTGNSEKFARMHLAIGRVTLAIAVCGAACVLIINSMVVELLAGKAFWAGTMVNTWFAVALIITPLAGLFQTLLPISGSMGKAAPVAIIKLLLGGSLATVLWPFFDLSGLAAVFALLPIIDLWYSYNRGTRALGYAKNGLSSQLLVLGLIAILLTILAGFFTPGISTYGFSASLFGRLVHLPTPTALTAPLVLLLIGLLSLIYSAKKLIQVR